MRKIKGILIILFMLLVVLPIIGKLLGAVYPESIIEEVFMWFPQLFWTVFKQFKLKSFLLSSGLFIVIAIILNGAGMYISRKKENIIYEIIALILTIIGLCSGSLV